MNSVQQDLNPKQRILLKRRSLITNLRSVPAVAPFGFLLLLGIGVAFSSLEPFPGILAPIFLLPLTVVLPLFLFGLTLPRTVYLSRGKLYGSGKKPKDGIPLNRLQFQLEDRYLLFIPVVRAVIFLTKEGKRCFFVNSVYYGRKEIEAMLVELAIELEAGKEEEITDVTG